MGLRQEKIARLLQKDLGEIFQQKANDFFGGAFITVSNVIMTPDLGVAKVYLSFLNTKDKEALIDEVNFKNKELRQLLAARIKNQVRKIPELSFYIDDTLDYVWKMEKVFEQINKDKKDNKNTEE